MHEIALRPLAEEGPTVFSGTRPVYRGYEMHVLVVFVFVVVVGACPLTGRCCATFRAMLRQRFFGNAGLCWIRWLTHWLPTL